MFVRYFFSKNKPIFHRSGLVTRQFSNNTENPKDTPPKQNRGREIVITPKRLFAGAVLISWLYILKVWFGAEEKGRMRAQEYYDNGGSVDVNLPEEYRKEYADKLIRKMMKKKEKDDGKVSELTIVTSDNGDD